MAHRDAFVVIHGGEVDALVPLLKQSAVGGELVQLLIGQRQLQRRQGRFQDLSVHPYHYNKLFPPCPGAGAPRGRGTW